MRCSGTTERDQPLVDRLRSGHRAGGSPRALDYHGRAAANCGSRSGTAAPASLTPPQVAEVSSTGSGDVLHACLICSVFHHQLSLSDALQRALPYAAANAAHRAVADSHCPTCPISGPPRSRAVCSGAPTFANSCDTIVSSSWHVSPDHHRDPGQTESRTPRSEAPTLSLALAVAKPLFRGFYL